MCAVTTMRAWAGAALVAAALTVFTAALGAPARATTIAAPDVPAGQPEPMAHPYDESADAHAAVVAAFAEAKRSHRDVLLDFGANWCPDCRMLSGMFAQSTVAPWLAHHFVVVLVDVGRFTKNMDIAARYGVRVKAIPAVLVLAADGHLKDPDGAQALGNARTMSTKATVDLIAAWDRR